MLATHGRWEGQESRIGLRISRGRAVYFAEVSLPEVPGAGKTLFQQDFDTIEDALLELELDIRPDEVSRLELLAQAEFLRGMV